MLGDSNWANVEHRAGVRPVPNHAGERAATKLNCADFKTRFRPALRLFIGFPEKNPRSSTVLIWLMAKSVGGDGRSCKTTL
jgi:hypothetical protein